MRITALWLTVLAAAGSIGMVLWVGRHQTSMVLPVMFTIWVSSPFAGLLWMHRRVIAITERRRQGAYWLICLVSSGTLALYFVTSFMVHIAKTAGPFLAVPLASWVVIGVWAGINRQSRG